MPTQISGSTGVSKVQDGVVVQADLGPNVAGNGPLFSASRLADQSIPQTVFTKILFNSEDIDTSNCFDTTTGRFTPNVAGYYQINASLNWVAGTSGVRLCTLYKNGVRYRDGVFATDSNNLSTPLSAVVYLDGVSDYVEIYAYCTGPATLNVSLVAHSTFFQGFLVRAA